MDKTLAPLVEAISGMRHDQQLLGDKLIEFMEKVMASLDDIAARVKAESDVVDSAVALINGFKDKLDAAIANGADPAKLQQLSDDIGSQTDRLSAAVAANTPASTPAAESTVSDVPPAPADSGTPQ